MCVSSGMKDTVNSIKSFTGVLKNQAQSVYGAANQVFNSLFNSFNTISNAGPGQFGYTQPEWNAIQSEIKTNAANSTRAMLTGTKSALAGIGGGNVPAISGAEDAQIMAANQAAAAQESQALTGATIAGYEQGNKNWQYATGQEAKLPDVYNAATNMDKAVTEQQNTQLNAQQALDSEGNMWKNAVVSLAGSAIGGISGGIGTALGKGLLANTANTATQTATQAAPAAAPGVTAGTGLGFD